MDDDATELERLQQENKILRSAIDGWRSLVEDSSDWRAPLYLSGQRFARSGDDPKEWTNTLSIVCSQNKVGT